MLVNSLSLLFVTITLRGCASSLLSMHKIVVMLISGDPIWVAILMLIIYIEIPSYIFFHLAKDKSQCSKDPYKAIHHVMLIVYNVFHL